MNLRKSVLSCFTVLFLGLHPTLKAQIVEEGFWVQDPKKIYLKHFQNNKDLTLDHLNHDGYEVWGPKGLEEWHLLKDLGATRLDLLSEEEKSNQANYPTHEMITSQLKAVVNRCPEIMALESLGKSKQGRDLWMVKVSDNPSQDEQEPEVKYIANMHGNEIVGRELMVKLLEDICRNYPKDPEISFLVENLETFIVPSMNPDGATLQRRGNANFVDLNRSFPDFTTDDNQNTFENRPIETQIIMKWQAQRNFALSANFHGGAVVANYPWDTTHEKHAYEDLAKSVALYYAQGVKEMRNSDEFPGGIVRGASWYQVDGGMQDWSLFWYGDLQITFEVSEEKWPSYSSVEGYYREHRDSLLKFLLQGTQGVGIVVKNFPKINSLLDEPEYKVKVSEMTGPDLAGRRPFGEYQVKGSEFYRLFPKGDYLFEVDIQGVQHRFMKKVGPIGIGPLQSTPYFTIE